MENMFLPLALVFCVIVISLSCSEGVYRPSLVAKLAFSHCMCSVLIFLTQVYDTSSLLLCIMVTVTQFLQLSKEK